MTTLLDEAVSRLRERPASEQDTAAAALLAYLENRDPQYGLSPKQVEQVRATLDGLSTGEIRVATDAEVEAMWRRLGA